ncbi:hypothetical protein FEM48_Zijuj01G0158600 [Ziziphus jujuba var. spinosa]|uniref:Uncharacterized protein n=1 Tax=Ziziphus jujuba var. spinosa TaxID=714518 RepID=A0A978W257_ZIZJJ|nr:hypothetical protein FEM48_Zijuj01G0158600 [Ziziphus jujuba var. spinosa]
MEYEAIRTVETTIRRCVAWVSGSLVGKHILCINEEAVPSNRRLRVTNRLVLGEFLQTGVLKDITRCGVDAADSSSPTKHEAPGDSHGSVVGCSAPEIPSTASFLGLVRRGLPIDLNEPPPLWM